MNYDAMVAALQQRDWIQAETLGRAAVVHHPRNAQLWELLGECFEHQQRTVAAFRCYDRAWMLDPRAGWAQAARRRLSAVWGNRIETLPEWLETALWVPQVRVVGAMIVRNEEGGVARALDRLRPAVDEIVVVDTGSSDNTVDIAQKAGAKVITHMWRDDFSEARNAALPFLGEEGWVLWVDADEWLEPEDVHVPRTLAGMWGDEVVLARLVQVNWFGGRTNPNYDTTRFYPLGRGIHWTGPIHEQVTLPPGLAATARPSVRIRVEHHGYEDAVVKGKGKFERNIRILRHVVETQPENVASLGFLGRELFMTGDLDEAIAVLVRADNLAADRPEYARRSEVRHVLIEAYLKAGRLADAVALADRLVDDDPGFPGGWYLRGQVHLQQMLRHLGEAGRSFEESIRTAGTYRGIVSFHADIPGILAPSGIADVLRFRGDWAAAWSRYDAVQQREWTENVAKQQNAMKLACQALQHSMAAGNSEERRE